MAPLASSASERAPAQVGGHSRTPRASPRFQRSPLTLGVSGGSQQGCWQLVAGGRLSGLAEVEVSSVLGQCNANGVPGQRRDGCNGLQTRQPTASWLARCSQVTLAFGDGLRQCDLGRNVLRRWPRSVLGRRGGVRGPQLPAALRAVAALRK